MKFQNKIKKFCLQRSQKITENALNSLQGLSYDALPDKSKALLSKFADEAVASGKEQYEAYYAIVKEVFGNQVTMMSKESRSPVLLAALLLSKKDWADFHNQHINAFSEYFSKASYSVSKIYVSLIIEKTKRKKAKDAEKSLSITNLFVKTNTSTEYEN